MLSGASLSVVNSTACSATLFRMSISFFGSTALIETPATPRVKRSFSTRRCSAAVASEITWISQV